MGGPCAVLASLLASCARSRLLKTEKLLSSPGGSARAESAIVMETAKKRRIARMRNYLDHAPAVANFRGHRNNKAVSSPVISLRNLGKRFGRFEAVRGLTFDIERGAIFGFLGA